MSGGLRQTLYKAAHLTIVEVMVRTVFRRRPCVGLEAEERDRIAYLQYKREKRAHALNSGFKYIVSTKQAGSLSTRIFFVQ